MAEIQRISVSLSIEEFKEVKIFLIEEGLTMQSYVGNLIREDMKKHKREKKK